MNLQNQKASEEKNGENISDVDVVCKNVYFIFALHLGYFFTNKHTNWLIKKNQNIICETNSVTR